MSKSGAFPLSPAQPSRWRKFKIRFRYLYWQRLPSWLRHPFEYAYDHVFHGARPVKIGVADPFRQAQGELVDDGIDIQFGGACPVQGDGTVDGRVMYYRSRGSGWELSIAKEGKRMREPLEGFFPDSPALDEEAWVFAEHPYHWPDGGWVHADVSRECIRRAVAKWRAEGRP